MKATKKQLEAINRLEILKGSVENTINNNDEAIEFVEYILSIKKLTKITLFEQSLLENYIETLKYYKEN